MADSGAPLVTRPPPFPWEGLAKDRADKAFLKAKAELQALTSKPAPVEGIPWDGHLSASIVSRVLEGLKVWEIPIGQSTGTGILDAIRQAEQDEICLWRIRYGAAEAMAADTQKLLGPGYFFNSSIDRGSLIGYNSSGPYVGVHTGGAVEFPEYKWYPKTVVDGAVKADPSYVTDPAAYYVPGNEQLTPPIANWSVDSQYVGEWFVPAAWPTAGTKDTLALARGLDVHTAGALTQTSKIQDALQDFLPVDKLNNWGVLLKDLLQRVQGEADPLKAIKLFLDGRQDLDKQLEQIVGEIDAKYAQYRKVFEQSKDAFLLDNSAQVAEKVGASFHVVLAEYLRWFDVIGGRVDSAYEMCKQKCAETRGQLLDTELKVQNVNLQNAEAQRQQMQEEIDKAHSGWLQVVLVIVAVVAVAAAVYFGGPAVGVVVANLFLGVV